MHAHGGRDLIHHFRPVTPNIGNDLSVLALLRLVQHASTHPRNIVALPASGVTAAIKKGGLNRSTVHDLNELAQGALIGPGNLFENNALEVDRVALAALRVPHLLCAVSWGRIFDDRGCLNARTDAMPADTIRALCERSSGVLVRDEVTRAHLASLGVDRAQVVGCPVLSLDPSSLPLPSPDSRAVDAVLVSIRTPLLMNVSPRLQGQVFADVRLILSGLRDQGHEKIALLCHDPRDLRFAAAFPDVPSLYTEDPLAFLGWLRDCRLSVTFRLHGFLACAVVGTPAVHLSYDERAIGLIEVAALGDCDVDYVRTANPIERALAKAREPDALRKVACNARRGWPALREKTEGAIRAWMRDMDAPRS